MNWRKIKHVIPVIKGHVKPAQERPKLDECLNRLKSQLDISYSNRFVDSGRMGFGVSKLEVDVYDGAPERVMLPSFEPIRSFKYDARDYPIPENRLKSAPFEFAESKFPIVDKNTPICTDAKLLKGVNNDLFVVAFAKGLTKKRSLHKCKWFFFNYWHSSTFCGSILKSRPGVMVTCHNTHIFNSTSEITGKIPSEIQNTSYPFKYAVYRTRVKKLTRKAFMDHYLKNRKVSERYDGLYKFSVSLYPTTESEIEDFKKNIELCIDKVSKIDLAALEKEGRTDFAKLPQYKINRVLSRNNISTIFKNSFGTQKTKKKVVYKQHDGKETT